MIYITGRIQTGGFRHTAPILLSIRLAKYLIAGCAAHGVPRNRQTVRVVGCCRAHNRCSKYSRRCRCHFLTGSSQFYRSVCLCIRAKHIRVFRLHDRCFVGVAGFSCLFDNVQQLPCILIATINAVTARIRHSVPCQLHPAGLQCGCLHLCRRLYLYILLSDALLCRFCRIHRHRAAQDGQRQCNTRRPSSLFFHHNSSLLFPLV